jgi:hypothetical protein
MTIRRGLLTRARSPWVLVPLAMVLAATFATSWALWPAAGNCNELFVPAYFYNPALWQRADKSGTALGYVILDITGMGAGGSPSPQFQELARGARSAGIGVLGYSSTVDGQRPVSQVEADIRNYSAWYGVTGMFLDRVTGSAQQMPYYRQVASYVRATIPHAQVWMNVGTYPQDPQYLSIGSVVNVFEGSYAQFEADTIPGWAASFPAAKFAYTIVGASKADMSRVLGQLRRRGAGHVYVTDGSGDDPYSSLPGYWSDEVATARASCGDPAPSARAAEDSTDSDGGA